MLDNKDLHAVRELIDTSVTASEERMKTYMDASEERMKAYMDASVTASEKRMKAYMDAAENRWMVIYEGSIQPQLQLLAEGHESLLETLAPKSRVEALEDEVVFTKSVMKAMNQEIADLKKAQ